MKEKIIFYFFGVFLLYPIVAYYLKIPYITPFQGLVQVLLSGPSLAVFGLILIFNYKDKLVGIIFFLAGIWWIANIIYEMATK